MLLLWGSATTVNGQFRGGPTSALSLATGRVVFSLTEADPAANFEFDDAVFGVVFSRQGVYASVVSGSGRSAIGFTNGTSSPAELNLFDVNLAISGSLFRDLTDQLPFYLPVMLHSTYRRIKRSDSGAEFTVFEYTGLGLGAGVGVRTEGENWSIDAHATPGIGIASRSFGNSTGSTLLFDGDVQFMMGPIFGRFGIALGYNYRWQSWRVGGPDAFDVAGSGRVTYSGGAHAVRVGVSW